MLAYGSLGVSDGAWRLAGPSTPLGAVHRLTIRSKLSIIKYLLIAYNCIQLHNLILISVYSFRSLAGHGQAVP